MGKVVYKYPLALGEMNRVHIPGGGVVLAFQAQNDIPCLWVQVTPDAKPVERHFVLVPTGHHFSGALRHIGTTQLAGGRLVFHCYEELEPL